MRQDDQPIGGKFADELSHQQLQNVLSSIKNNGIRANVDWNSQTIVVPDAEGQDVNERDIAMIVGRVSGFFTGQLKVKKSGSDLIVFNSQSSRSPLGLGE